MLYAQNRFRSYQAEEFFYPDKSDDFVSAADLTGIIKISKVPGVFTPNPAERS